MTVGSRCVGVLSALFAISACSCISSRSYLSGRLICLLPFLRTTSGKVLIGCAESLASSSDGS